MKDYIHILPVVKNKKLCSGFSQDLKSRFEQSQKCSNLISQGGDFYCDERGACGRVFSYMTSESKSQQDISYNHFAH